MAASYAYAYPNEVRLSNQIVADDLIAPTTWSHSHIIIFRRHPPSPDTASANLGQEMKDCDGMRSREVPPSFNVGNFGE